jgi:CPA1 family monovalent cation:H+ antiporter
MIALLFGSIISATDPISVLSIFQEMGVGKRLSMIVEGESLFNDGTAVVLFGILLTGISTGRLNVVTGVEDFLVVVLGGAALGTFLGYLFSKITQRIDEPRIEEGIDEALLLPGTNCRQGARVFNRFARVFGSGI